MIKKIILFLLNKYIKYLSPYLGNVCRFYPSCADYSIEAIKSFGVLRGIWKSFKRIIRCNPFCKGGYDPVHNINTN